MEVFVGGARDCASRIVASYQQAHRRAHPHGVSLYFEWNQVRQIVEAVCQARRDRPAEPLHLVGHSYGAATAALVSRKLQAIGHEVDLLITVDPVSRWWSRGHGVARRWVNVTSAPETPNGFSGDAWAAMGGKWGAWPQGRAHAHCEAPYSHNEFGAMLEFVPVEGRSALQVLLGEGGGGELAGWSCAPARHCPANRSGLAPTGHSLFGRRPKK